MRFAFQEPSLLSLALVLCVAPLSTVAVPWATSDSTQSLSRHHGSKQPSYRSHSVFPQLTWLRDTAIEKIFGVPPKSKSTQSHDTAFEGHRRPSSSPLPATLLAKYGGDVVLRFNISTSEEEAALAEAADTLFLDVWEFTNNWADIRLAEDDVAISWKSLTGTFTNGCIRYRHFWDFFPNHSTRPTPR